MTSEWSHYHELVGLEGIQFLSLFMNNSCESVNSDYRQFCASLHKLGLICIGVVTLIERMLINLEAEDTESVD
jgi:hypothetical protein